MTQRTDVASAGFADSRSRRPRGSQLSPAEERDLVVAVEGGDEVACRELVDAFLPAIGGIARRFDTGGVERGELMQEGVAGLLLAAKRYDPRLKTPFWAYASFWVRKAMQELVEEVSRPVALSDHAVRALARIRAARRDHLEAHGAEATNEELVATTGFTPAQLNSLLAVERTPRGFDDPVSAEEGGPATFGETIADPGAEQAYRHVLDTIEVRDLAELLDEREHTVLWSHYGLGGPAQTLSGIAAVLGLTAERVRQIEVDALAKLREAAAEPPDPAREST